MLIDTSGWYCLFDDADSRNPKALNFYQSAEFRWTHSFCIDELVALLEARKQNRARSLNFILDILNDSEIQIVWVDEELVRRGMELLLNRPDKSWSLCDSVSFMIMGDERFIEALTTDHHFKQAGFIQLLES